MRQLPNEIWAAVIGVLGTVVGVLLGACMSTKLSRKAAQDLLVLQARAEFAGAFVDILVKLDSEVVESGEGAALEMLQLAYPLHLAAYIKLRSVLPKREQRASDEAWRQYTRDDKYEHQEERRVYRFMQVLNADSDKQQYLLAKEHIERLLVATGVSVC